MGENALAQYINEQLKKGYTANQIREYLINYGYPTETVNKILINNNNNNNNRNNHYINNNYNTNQNKTEKQGFFSKLFSRKPANMEISNYVLDNLKKGYPIISIKEVLNQYNYDPGVLKASIKHAQKNFKAFQNNLEPNKNNTSYKSIFNINDNKLNYNNKNNYESKNNYSTNNNMNDFNSYNTNNQNNNNTNIKHTIDVSNKTFIMIFLIVAGIGLLAGSLYMLILKDEPTELMDYKLTLDSDQIKPGEKLFFTNNFYNMGTKRKYDIIINHTISNMDTGEVLKSKSETIRISDSLIRNDKIEIPSDTIPGKYKLSGSVMYDDQIALSHESFTIISETAVPTCFDKLKNQNEEDVDCGGVCKVCDKPIEKTETCFDKEKNQNEEDVDCGGVCKACDKPIEKTETCFDKEKNQDEEDVDCGGVCNPCVTSDIKPDNKEILKKVKAMGIINEQESIRLCREVDNQRMQDQCFLSIAQSFNKSKYCMRLEIDTLIDTCYMHFVQMNDYTICDKINDVHIKRTCEVLKQMNSIMEQQNMTMNP